MINLTASGALVGFEAQTQSYKPQSTTCSYSCRPAAELRRWVHASQPQWPLAAGRAHDCARAALAPWRRQHFPTGLPNWDGAAAAELGVLNRPGAFPFAVELPDAGAPTVLCIPPKVGTTLWHLAMERALARAELELSGTAHARKSSTACDVPCSTKPGALWRHGGEATLLNDSRVARVLFTRNPFDRLLSAFLEKEVGDGLFSGSRAPETAGGFTAFAANLSALPVGQLKRVNMHFKPQHLLCGLPQGFRYDYVLPLEEMGSWYAPLAVLLGLDGAAQDARLWQHTSDAWRTARSCFYTTTAAAGDCTLVGAEIERLHSCTAPAAPPVVRPPQLAAAPMLESGEHGHTAHETGAAKKRSSFYTQALVDNLASSLLKQDVELLGYEVPVVR